MITPPTNSAATNCQPMSTASTMPSSTTRLVEATMKTIDATKSAPPAKRDLAMADAAYEHDDDRAPNMPARVIAAGRWSPRRARICSRDTNACTAPDRPNPTTSAHSVSQNMLNASRRL